MQNKNKKGNNFQGNMYVKKIEEHVTLRRNAEKE